MYFCADMPICLLQHIIRQQAGIPYTGIRRIEPASDVNTYIENFYVLPCIPELSDKLTCNDGTLMMAFMSDPRGIVKIGQQGLQIESGWFSASFTANTYLRLSAEVEWLLVIRFREDAPGNFSPKVSRQSFGSISSWGETGEGQALLTSVNRSATAKAKVHAIEQFFRTLPKASIPACGLLKEAVRSIRIRKGNISVTEIANELKVNSKWLERHFVVHTGMTPKSYACIQRFVHAYSELLANGENDLTGIAVDNGYCDLSHFIKSFKRFTGKTPLQYYKQNTDAAGK
ncbi:helix-turn-helix domain-containing protein [Bacteroides fragilis]|uniref:helix-turn-helix domain-containing protein n=1 Tax=Bacteroides fragilis TaxID=817 RepID=UPI0022AA7ADC|nr:helix-turn-helix domain-containing protein [Bacteroides fragilis]MCZ2661013.1 helix-turn-helix domain-containing protein [Bacteroides fragilis]